jgi:uncharacterized protein YndB with AHSA1/START domain
VHATSVTAHVRAPRAEVYGALLDPDAVAAWRVPDERVALIPTYWWF